MGTIRKRDNIWYVDFMYRGRRYRRAVGPNKTEAQILLGKVEPQIRENKFFDIDETADVRFPEIAEDFREYSKATKRSARRDQLSLKHLTEFFGDMRIIDIAPNLIEKYKIQRSQKVTPSTVNRELACLKTAFNKAIEAGKCRSNPVKKVKLFRENPPKLRTLIDNCDPQIKPIVILALHTGMRKGEIFPLKWEDIDWNNKVIWLGKTKSGKTAYIPMDNTVIEELKTIASHKKNPYIFAKGNGHYKESRKRFAKALQGSGIKDCSFHTLRHTFASHLVMAGVDLATVRELMRHRTYQMTLRYSHLAPAHKRKAMQVFDEWLS